MKIINNKKKLTDLLKDNINIGFVPTMGAIHKGHISLIKKSILQSKITVVSIFVNRTQFNRAIDFKKYPRNTKKDVSLLKKFKVDYVFIPNNKDIYPYGARKKIYLHQFSKQLCGKDRPGHFKAVVDVIDRFITIIKPKRIYFGEKDFQQFLLVTDFIKKSKIKTKIIKCKTVREKNGLAISSRNSLLTFKEKKIAANVYKYLFNKKKGLIKKQINLNKIKTKILDSGVKKIDYIKILNLNNFFNFKKTTKKNKLFFAYYIRNIRLIDNI